MDWGLNNREIAILFWLGVVGVWALRSADVRGSCWQVVVAFFHPKLLATVLAAAAYCAGLIWLGASVGLWDTSLVNDTVIWFVSVALVLMFSSNQMSHDEHYLRRAFRRTVTATVLIEGAVNLFVLPLPVELVLFPTVSWLVMMVAFAGDNDEYALLVKLINGFLSFVGAALLLFVLAHIRVSLDTVDWAHIGLQLALPVWLTIGVLPFIYLIGTYTVFESTFTRIDFLGENIGMSRRSRRRAKVVLLVGTRCRARLVGGFIGPWPKRLVQVPSFAAARAIVAEYRAGGYNDAEDLAAIWDRPDDKDDLDDEAPALAS
jgi:hypothetical protein